MSNAGIPLRVIQEISGHRNLEQLQRYLEVRPEQVRGAIASLSMLSYTGKDKNTGTLVPNPAEWSRYGLDWRRGYEQSNSVLFNPVVSQASSHNQLL